MCVELGLDHHYLKAKGIVRERAALIKLFEIIAPRYELVSSLPFVPLYIILILDVSGKD